jgi:putative sigma-54 modulation protein
MEVTIHGLNMKVNEAIDDYARKRLDRLDRYLPGIMDVRLELSHENTKGSGDLSIAQLTLRHRRGALMRVEERAANGDMEMAINSAVDKMYRRIERFKGKRSAKGRERFVLTQEELDAAEEMPEFEDELSEAERYVEPAILRRKDVEVISMTENEAAEQMELLGHTFFMFFNPEQGQVNVIYKRENGGYGVLVPNIQ